jgi:glycosyltransferase involved in cell wall biosynthesis
MMVAAPVVSVIIPSYNAGEFISRAIDSVRAQTFTNWEILVIDNHSRDSTTKVVQSYDDDRIALHRIHNNGVIAASRNMGIRAAKGGWLAFLDADDWWVPNKLERCLEVAGRNVDIVYHSLREVKLAGELVEGPTISSRQVKSPVFLDLIRRGNALWTSSVLARADVVAEVGGFSEDPAMVGIEDYNLWLRLSLATERFAYVKEVLGFYLNHGSNTSGGDMSGPFEAAVSPFYPRLKRVDQRRVREIAAYLEARHGYARGEYSRIRGGLLRLVLSARPVVRFKALARLLMALRPDAPSAR